MVVAGALPGTSLCACYVVLAELAVLVTDAPGCLDRLQAQMETLAGSASTGQKPVLCVAIANFPP
jgi:hypothetical protein